MVDQIKIIIEIIEEEGRTITTETIAEIMGEVEAEIMATAEEDEGVEEVE
jgi:hypothetical protein